MRRLHFCLLLLSLLTAGASAEQGNASMDLERSVCGLKEPLLFWLWSSQAGTPDASRLRGISNAERISFQTEDGRVLAGYRLNATSANKQLQSGKPKGYLLVLQGNAMLADQILEEFQAFAEAGYDVYIYDYRGYGHSEGKRRLKAIVHDYRAILAKLNSGNYAEKLVYALSLGGIILLDAISSETLLDRVVIDSTPSRLSDYGCPSSYDPINHLPANCRHLMLIVGQRDRVVTPSMSAELGQLAQKRGATIVDDREFSHPFMDSDWTVHQRRMRLIQDYLMARD